MSLFDIISADDLNGVIALIEKSGPSIVNKHCFPASSSEEGEPGEGEHPLLLAARLARAEIVQNLLRVDGIDVCGAVDAEGRNVMHNAVAGITKRAATADDMEVLKLLCQHNDGELLNSPVAGADHLVTPLSIAIDSGSLDTALFLLAQPHICTTLRNHHNEQLKLLSEQQALSGDSLKRAVAAAPVPLLYRAVPTASLVESLLRHYRNDAADAGCPPHPSCTCDKTFGAEVLALRNDTTLHLAVELDAVDTARLLVEWAGVDPRAARTNRVTGRTVRALDLARELQREAIIEIMDPVRPFRELGALGTIGLCDVFGKYRRGAVPVQQLRDAFTPNSSWATGSGGLSAAERRAIQRAAEEVAFGKQQDEDGSACNNDDVEGGLRPLLSFVRSLAACSHANETRMLWRKLRQKQREEEEGDAGVCNFTDEAIHEAVSVTATVCFMSRFAAGHGIRLHEMEEEERVAVERRNNSSSNASSSPLSHLALLQEGNLVPQNFVDMDHFGHGGGIPTEVELGAHQRNLDAKKEELEDVRRQWQDNQLLLAGIVAGDVLQRRELESRLVALQAEEVARLQVVNEAMSNELRLLQAAMSTVANLEKENRQLLASNSKMQEKAAEQPQQQQQKQQAPAPSLSDSSSGDGGGSGDGGLRLLRNMFVSETMIRKESEQRAQLRLRERDLRLNLVLEFRPYVSLEPHNDSRAAAAAAEATRRDSYYQQIRSGEESFRGHGEEASIDKALQRADEAMAAAGNDRRASMPFKPRPPSSGSSGAVGSQQQFGTPAASGEASSSAAEGQQHEENKVRGEYTPFSAKPRRPAPPPRLIGSQLCSPRPTSATVAAAAAAPTEQNFKGGKNGGESPPSYAPFTARQLHPSADEMENYPEPADLFKGYAITDAALQAQFDAVDRSGNGVLEKDEFAKFFVDELEDYGLHMTEWEFEQLWWKVVGKGRNTMKFEQFAIFMLKRANM